MKTWWYPVSSIAEMFEVNPSTVMRWIKKGFLKAEKKKYKGRLVWAATGNSIVEFLDIVQNKPYYRYSTKFYKYEMVSLGYIYKEFKEV